MNGVIILFRDMFNKLKLDYIIYISKQMDLIQLHTPHNFDNNRSFIYGNHYWNHIYPYLEIHPLQLFRDISKLIRDISPNNWRYL